MISLWDTNGASAQYDAQTPRHMMPLKPCQTYEHPNGEAIAAFDWHASEENRVLTVTHAGTIQAHSTGLRSLLACLP